MIILIWMEFDKNLSDWLLCFLRLHMQSFYLYIGSMFECQTIHFKNYAHTFDFLNFYCNQLHASLTYMLPYYFTGIEVILQLPWCQLKHSCRIIEIDKQEQML